MPDLTSFAGGAPLSVLAAGTAFVCTAGRQTLRVSAVGLPAGPAAPEVKPPDPQIDRLCGSGTAAFQFMVGIIRDTEISRALRVVLPRTGLGLVIPGAFCGDLIGPASGLGYGTGLYAAAAWSVLLSIVAGDFGHRRPVCALSRQATDRRAGLRACAFGRVS